MTTLTPEDRDALRALAAEYDDDGFSPLPSKAGDAIHTLLDALDQAEAERDGARELLNAHKCDEQAERAYQRAMRAEAERDHARAQVDRVRDVLDRARDEFEQPNEADIRRALEG